MTTMRIHSSISFVLYLFPKTIRAFQVNKGPLAHFIQLDQHGVITKHVIYCKVLLRRDVFVATAVVAY